MKKKILRCALLSLMTISLTPLASCSHTSTSSVVTQGEKGDKGDKGDTGAKGDTGEKGDKGDTGTGIASAKIDENGDLIITYTDGKTVNAGKVDGYNQNVGYQIAKKFGYQYDYGTWVNQIISKELGLQYNVELSSDYKTFVYGWENTSVTLDEFNILLDSRLTDAEVNGHSFIYNDIKKAIEACKAGTEERKMNLYIAPGVYWVHDPASESTTEAYQITKDCANMSWIGLSDDRRNVVLAFNYGHDEGYAGSNPTCFNITGDNFSIENMTIGGYCNVDLEFPLNDSLNVEKRSTNVTQCQLGAYNSDKLFCENVSFVSRLNMNPFVSTKRAFYKDCHFESTDDAMNGSAKAVYLNCDFDFYASKPWYSSSGSTLLNCKFNLVHINTGETNTQYLAKAESRFNVIDCAFTDTTNTYQIGWSDVLSSTFRSYYSNVTYNNKKIDMGAGVNSDKSVDITGTELLKAYKLTTAKGKTIYNIYNLLKGTDSWDPLGQKALIESMHAEDIPTDMTLSATSATLETSKTGNDRITLDYSIKGLLATDYKAASSVTWSVDEKDQDVVTLQTNDDKTCTVIANNDTDESRKVLVTGKDKSGLVAVAEITILPSVLPLSKATNLSITQNADGTASVDYTISDLGTRSDLSRINWYICDDAQGSNPRHIATGRTDTPLKTIKLHEAYIGKYLMAEVESKHIRSEYQEKETCISSTAITQTGIDTSLSYDVDLSSFVTENNQTKEAGYWYVNNVDYGVGYKNGFLGYEGLFFNGNNSTTPAFSEIDYTPVAKAYKDMDVTLKVAPGKTAGQGFGSNNNFLEVRLKYDLETNSGYAVRIVRTSGDSTKVQLVEKKADNTVAILKESGDTSVYMTECTIHAWVKDNKFYTHIETTKEQPSTAVAKGYLDKVDLEADITNTSTKGGFGAYLESSTGDNTTYIGSIKMNWTI